MHWSNLIINLKDTFFDTAVGPRSNLARIHVPIETRLALTKKNLPNPPQGGYKGLSMCVGGDDDVG